LDQNKAILKVNDKKALSDLELRRLTWEYENGILTFPMQPNDWKLHDPVYAWQQKQVAKRKAKHHHQLVWFRR
jgi:hypothetical protein